MTIADKLVLQRQHHLKWRSLDWLELVLMIICGVWVPVFAGTTRGDAPSHRFN